MLDVEGFIQHRCYECRVEYRSVWPHEQKDDDAIDVACKPCTLEATQRYRWCNETCSVCHIGPYNQCCHVRAHPLPVLDKYLREWRVKTAALRFLAPYNFMLEDFLPVIINRLPRSMEELRLCTFVDSYGTSKRMVESFLDREGQDIIMLVSLALVDMEVMPLVDMS